MEWPSAAAYQAIEHRDGVRAEVRGGVRHRPADRGRLRTAQAKTGELAMQVEIPRQRSATGITRFQLLPNAGLNVVA